MSRAVTALFQRLSVERDEAIRPPGAGLAGWWTEKDGRRLLLVSQGDAFDVYHGRKEPIVFSVSPATALRLAWWIIWSWWVVGTWCGVKTRLWTWALNRIVADAEKTITR
jgi:hypothetical protein